MPHVREVNMVILRMTEHSDRTVLAGALSGKSVLNWMLAKTMAEPDTPALVILDFSGVEVATVSFLRESVLAFRDIIRGRRSQYYPIVANINDLVREEFIELLRIRGGGLMTCHMSDDRRVREAAPLGQLDPKQQITFDLVQQHGETDAAELMRKYGKSERLKHANAWNNRLSALAAMGLVVERRQGRAKRYSSLVEGT